MSLIETLKDENAKLSAQVEQLILQVSILEEKLRLALFRQYGKASEKAFSGQLDLPFNIIEDNQTPEENKATTVAQHERRKRAGRKPLADNIPRTEHYHELSGQDLICKCGHSLRKIGEDVHEELNVIPMKVWVDRHHHSKYACPECQGTSDESVPGVKRAEGEARLFPRSIVTPGLLAQVIVAKFCDHLPFYRQEVGFARIGAEISRQDMSNWSLKAGGWIAPLIELLEKKLREGPVIRMDETPVKVLKLEEKGADGTGFMWLARGGPPQQPVARYRFAPGRGHQHAHAILEDWKGYLQTDGWGAYDTLIHGSQIIHVGCWAHARRKFVDAVKATHSALAQDVIGRIGKLYEFEKTSRIEAKRLELDDQGFLKLRQDLVLPYLKSFKEWMTITLAQTLPSATLAKAFAYTLNQWDKLDKFVLHAELTPDNNLAENAIRPFVLGRKNWLFAGNDLGAEASARFYTLIETAKLNGLEPHSYLMNVFTKLPTVRNTNNWDSLLPWNIKV